MDFKIVPTQLILFLFNQINKRVFSMGKKKLEATNRNPWCSFTKLWVLYFVSHFLCTCCIKYWCYVWKDTNWPLLHCLLTALMFHYFLQSRDEMDEWILIIVSWWLFSQIIFLDKHQLIWQIMNSLLYSVVGIKLLTGTCREHKRTVSLDKMHWMLAMPVFNFNQ